MYDINELTAMKKHWLLRTSNIPRRFLGLEPQDIVDRSGEFPSEVATWIDDAVGGHVIKQIGSIGINGVGLLFDGGPGIGTMQSEYRFLSRSPSPESNRAPPTSRCTNTSKNLRLIRVPCALRLHS